MDLVHPCKSVRPLHHRPPSNDIKNPKTTVFDQAEYMGVLDPLETPFRTKTRQEGYVISSSVLRSFFQNPLNGKTEQLSIGSGSIFKSRDSSQNLDSL